MQSGINNAATTLVVLVCYRELSKSMIIVFVITRSQNITSKKIRRDAKRKT